MNPASTDRNAIAAAIAEEMEDQSAVHPGGPALMAAGYADYQKYFAIALSIADHVQATAGVIEPAQFKVIAGIALTVLHAVANGLPPAGQ